MFTTCGPAGAAVADLFAPLLSLDLLELLLPPQASAAAPNNAKPASTMRLNRAMVLLLWQDGFPNNYVCCARPGCIRRTDAEMKGECVPECLEGQLSRRRLLSTGLGLCLALVADGRRTERAMPAGAGSSPLAAPV